MASLTDYLLSKAVASRRRAAADLNERARLRSAVVLTVLGLSLSACAESPGAEFVGYWHTRPTVGAPPDDESVTRIRRDGDTWLAEGFRDSDRRYPVDTYPLTLANKQLHTAPYFGGMVVLSYLPSGDTVLVTAGKMVRTLDRVPAPSC